ncbi:MAG: hypothetical protein ABIP48_11050 [Planctomycetota bacterium]
MTLSIDHQRAKRALRLRIGRLRRRIDRRVRSLEREGRRLASWRTYVERFPAQAVLAAFGFGLAASSGLAAGWSRLLGRHLTHRALDKAVSGVWHEFEQLWAESAPSRTTPDESGAENGGP